MGKIKKIGINTAVTLALPLFIYIFFFVITRVSSAQILFGSITMIITIVRQSCLGILIAFALCINMPTFRVDMSVGSVVVLTSIVSASLTIQYDLSIWTMLLISIVLAMILSMITGLTYIILRIPMIVMSLGMVIIYEAITQIIFGGQGVAALHANTRLLGYSPYCYFVTLIAMVIYHVITEYTQYAYKTKLLAGNQTMAVRIGINEKTNVIQGFAIGGFFLGLATMMYVSAYGLVEVAANMSSGAVMFSSLLPVIIGLILGQFSCNTIGVAVSVISMKMISYGLFCLGFNSTVQDVVSGSLILVLVIASGSLAMLPEKRRISQRIKDLHTQINP